ncbi:DUF4367 domain-containing protein [Paenibacillus cisolokensis]|uniref:DUF4367 domain-containing protein n=1 Tax=Paenibacillus cisolokensis TaxID=1658519 RepID=UPI003D2D79D7
MNEQNEQDRVIRKWLQDEYNSIEIPDPSPAWDKVRIQLERRRRHKKLRSRMAILAAVVAAALMINAAATISISKTYAQMSSLLQEVRNYFVEIFFTKEAFDHSAAVTAPPAPDEAEHAALPEEVSLEAAQAKLAFSLLVPAAMPDRYSLDRVRIFQEEDGQYRNAYLEYASSDQHIVKISQHVISPGSTRVKSDISASAGDIQQVWIGGSQGVLIIVPEGYATLEWLTEDGIKISISGKLTGQELMRVAESLH